MAHGQETHGAPPARRSSVAERPVAMGAELLKLARGSGSHVWIGHHPPFDCVALPLRGCTNFRASSVHHGRHDVVWYYEESPADLRPGQHELVFDELIRLIGARGRLVVRFHKDLRHFTIVALKHLLGRRYNTTICVESESLEDGWFTIVFGVVRHGLERSCSDEWTFAVLTQGKRVENVTAFCRSVREQDPDRRHEILIWGPDDPAYEPYGVVSHDGGYRDDLAEISRKKNDIAKRATRANLLIVHDRYRIDPGFFDGFARFGYDFDFVTVPQHYECGAHFPGYAALENGMFCKSRSIDCRDYDMIRDGQYVNGGLMVVKTETLRDVRLNDMLFWNQWEDVELTQQFRNRGLPPRVNCFSSATTLGITPEYTRAFLTERGRLSGIRRIASDVGAGIRTSVLARGRKIEQRLRPVMRRLSWKSRPAASL